MCTLKSCETQQLTRLDRKRREKYFLGFVRVAFLHLPTDLLVNQVEKEQSTIA
jgi:hypothetical protein